MGFWLRIFRISKLLTWRNKWHPLRDVMRPFTSISCLAFWAASITYEYTYRHQLNRSMISVSLRAPQKSQLPWLCFADGARRCPITKITKEILNRSSSRREDLSSTCFCNTYSSDLKLRESLPLRPQVFLISTNCSGEISALDTSMSPQGIPNTIPMSFSCT